MQLIKLTTLIGLCWSVSAGAMAETLTFAAQPVAGGGIDYSWFNPANWFTTDSTGTLVPAGRVPLDTEQAIITGPVDLAAGGVRVQGLVQTNNSTLTNGTLAVENLQLLSGSTIGNATVNVLTTLTVGGTNCTLNNATLAILGIASGSFQPVPPATAASLALTQASLLNVQGSLALAGGSEISGGGTPQSKIWLEAGAVLSSTNSVSVRGAANGHLIIDNSGLVQADRGVLSFSDGMDWQCSIGTGEFRANAASAVILFSNVFHADSTVTSLFTGTGTNRWLAGASIDGTAQVGAPGNLEILGSVSGAGTVHVLGTTNQGGVTTWRNGALALPVVQIDSGAGLVIAGTSGSTLQLAGCQVTNLGSCTVLSGEVGFDSGAVFNNSPGATLLVQGQGTFASTDGSGVVTNAGTVQLLGGALQFGDTNSTPGPAFNTTGLVDLRGGQLQIFGGANSGEFRQVAGTLLWFWGSAYALNVGTSFTGTNTVRVAQGAARATCQVNNAISLYSLELGLNGILDASGVTAGGTLQIDNLVTHDNGLMSNGTFQVQTLAMLDQSSAALSTIEVATSLTLGGTNCTLAGSVLNLSPGATGLMQLSGPGFGPTLNLTGGAVLQDAGALTLTDGSLIAGAGTPQSKLVVQSGGLLETTNSATLQGTTNTHLTVDNSGSVRVDAGSLTLANADLTTSGNLEVKSGTFAIQGSWLQTQGTTTVDTGAQLNGTNLVLQGGTFTGAGTIGGTLMNTGGNLSPGPAIGVLSMGPGSDYQQGSMGNLVVELGGSTPATQYDQLAIAGNAQLDGQLQIQLINGFVPSPGESFEVLTSRSQSGRFASIATPQVPGAVWLTRYNGTNVTLTVADNIEISRPTISGGALSFPVSTSPGIRYVVQASASLAPANWQTISTFTGDGSVRMVSDPVTGESRFYRVLLQ